MMWQTIVLVAAIITIIAFIILFFVLVYSLIIGADRRYHKQYQLHLNQMKRVEAELQKGRSHG